MPAAGPLPVQDGDERLEALDSTSVTPAGASKVSTADARQAQHEGHAPRVVVGGQQGSSKSASKFTHSASKATSVDLGTVSPMGRQTADPRMEAQQEKLDQQLGVAMRQWQASYRCAHPRDLLGCMSLVMS